MQHALVVLVVASKQAAVDETAVVWKPVAPVIQAA